MKLLPMLDECVPECGQCCSSVVPMSQVEATAIEGFLNKKPQWEVRNMFKRWASSEASRTQCPFMGGDYKCGVYEVRPGMCEAFGHVKTPPPGGTATMLCPREKAGEAIFTEWDQEKRRKVMDPIFASVNEHGVIMTGDFAKAGLTKFKRKSKKRKTKW